MQTPTADFLAAVFDGVLVIDAARRIVSANATACALFGITAFPPPPGAIIGQTVLEATHLRPLAELCATAAHSGFPCEADVQQVGRTERFLRARATPFENGVVLALADRTEINRLRTVRTEFVANVSHELRTPLASIRALAETLLDGALSDPNVNERFLQTIIREADRLVHLSEDLLELSRAESGRRERVTFDLRTVLAEVRERLTASAARQAITLTAILPETPLPIEADRAEMDQVFFNLLDNAIKYTPRGGTVTLRAVRHPASATISKPQVQVSITDSGIGILSQDLPRIFERFWRADRARKFRGSAGAAGENSAAAGGTGGTGLGLSIVKHIVEAHGGHVEAESELNVGSTFTVSLPLA